MARRPKRDSWATDCLALIRERLTDLGMDMDACPPMMYDDAIRVLATRLGRAAGCKTVADIRRIVQAPVRHQSPDWLLSESEFELWREAREAQPTDGTLDE